MLDAVQPEQQKKTNELKLQRNQKTYRQKIMKDTAQPEQQNKTNDLKPQEKEKNTSRR